MFFILSLSVSMHWRVALEGKLASPIVKRITITSIIITGMITEVKVTLLREIETKLIRTVICYVGTVVPTYYVITVMVTAIRPECVVNIR